jgi:hypothetical protein
MRDHLRFLPRACFAPDGSAGGAAAGGAAAGAGDPGAGGSAAAPVAFAEQLPAEIRTDGAFASIKSLEDLARGYHGYAKKFGVPNEQLVRLPAGDDDKEGHAALRKALGVPEAPDKYDFRDPAPETGAKIDAELKTWFGTKAHELGLSNKQAAQLYDAWNGLMGDRAKAGSEAQTKAATEATALLRKEWGQAFEAKLELAGQALKHYGGDEVASFLREQNLHNDPRIVRMFAKLGDNLAADGLLGRAPGSEGLLSPTEAKQQIAALETSPEWLKLKGSAPSTPGRAEIMAKRDQLYQVAYATEDRP